MRAKEFLKEYAIKVDGGVPGGGLNPANDMSSPKDIDSDNIDIAIGDMLYKLQQGEARDMDHALKMCACDMANEIGIEPEEAMSRIKSRLS